MRENETKFTNEMQMYKCNVSSQLMHIYKLYILASTAFGIIIISYFNSRTIMEYIMQINPHVQMYVNEWVCRACVFFL